ncbi:TPA: hypothetical protein ACH3X2_002436 [Trebouxia sp. C0005]
MALVPHASSTGKEESRGAIVAVRGAQELTQEEYEQRIKDAEVLEEKLKFITEKVPTRIMNVAGSNAGAGSGEFHMYRQARRREVMRQQRIEEEAVTDAAEREYQERKDKLAWEEEERTAKRRAKRQKKKVHLSLPMFHMCETVKTDDRQTSCLTEVFLRSTRQGQQLLAWGRAWRQPRLQRTLVMKALIKLTWIEM